MATLNCDKCAVALLPVKTWYGQYRCPTCLEEYFTGQKELTPYLVELATCDFCTKTCLGFPNQQPFRCQGCLKNVCVKCKPKYLYTNGLLMFCESCITQKIQQKVEYFPILGWR